VHFAMKTSVLKTKFGECVITEEQIRTAMREFDSEHRSTESDAGKRYAIEEAGQHYPPKRILQLATGVELGEFYGGRQSNDVFRNLGFQVANLPKRTEGRYPRKRLS